MRQNQNPQPTERDLLMHFYFKNTPTFWNFQTHNIIIMKNVNKFNYYLFSIKQRKKKEFCCKTWVKMRWIIILLMHWGDVFVNKLQIAEEMKPNTMVIRVLNALSRVVPSWRIVPGPDIIDIAFKVPEVREEVFRSIYFLV